MSEQQPANQTAEEKEESKLGKMRIVKPEFRKYLYAGFALFIALGLTALVVLGIVKMTEVKGFLKDILSTAMPFIWACGIAYLLATPCGWLDNLWKKVFKVKNDASTAAGNIRCVDAIFAVLVLLAVIVVLVVLVIPSLGDTVNSALKLFEQFQTGYDRFIIWLRRIFRNQDQILYYIDEYSTNLSTYVTDFFKEHVLPYTTTAMSSVGTGVVSVFTFVKNLAIGLVVSVYLLVARKRFKQQAKLLVYAVFTRKAADKIMEETRYTDKVFSGYINGKILDSLIIGILCLICCLIFKFPYPGLIAVIIGVTNMIPFFGPIIGAIPTSLIVLLATLSPLKFIWFLIFILALQQLDGNVIGPLVLGDSTGLNSFWVLFAIIIFSGWFGFVGMVIGVPVFAVIYHWVSEITFYSLKKKGEEEMLLNYLWKFDPVQARFVDERTKQDAENAEDRPGVEIVKENLKRQKDKALSLIKRSEAEENEKKAETEEIGEPPEHKKGNRRRKPGDT